MREYEIHPEDFGLRMAGTRALKVENAAGVDSHAARCAGKGTPGPAHDIVCLNARAALYAANVASSIEDGLGRAPRGDQYWRGAAKAAAAGGV